MGLPPPALRFLIRQHQQKPFHGAVLTFGRQNVYASLDAVLRMLKSEGVRVPAERVLQAKAAEKGKRYISDGTFFRLLGAQEVVALDCSDFEGAEIVHDLNVAVPAKLRNRFDLVVDGGTLEHVFDIRQVMMNIGLLLRPDGRVIHMSPTNNYVNHGFYQFSPTFFYDYYTTNKYKDLYGVLIEHSNYSPATRPWEVFALGSHVPLHMTSTQALMVAFVAAKDAASTIDRIPLQSLYQNLYQGAKTAQWSLKGLAKAWLPAELQQRLYRIFQMLPGCDASKKPWGLKRIGRLR